MAKKTFKVAGVTFSNGMFSTSRQEIIKKKCKVGDPVILERDYSNKHDDFAVKVLTKDREQVGYIPKGRAKSKRVFLSLEAKNDLIAKISDIYNFKDEYNDRIYGIRVEVENLLSTSKAKEVANKGCAGILLLFFTIITLLNFLI